MYMTKVVLIYPGVQLTASQLATLIPMLAVDTAGCMYEIWRVNLMRIIIA